MSSERSDLGARVKAIREAEGLSQAQFAEITGISISTIKKYETGVNEPASVTLLRLTTHDSFKKYTFWLMTGETNEAAGQISPALSPDGQKNISNHQSDQKAG